MTIQQTTRPSAPSRDGRQPQVHPLATTLAASNVVDIHNLVVSFGGYTAVNGVSLSVREGEFVALVGPTGCGKSTILNSIAGFLKPASGTVKLQGKPVSKVSNEVGYLFQQDSLLRWKSVRQNIGLGPQFRGDPANAIEQDVSRWLAKVGLARFGDRYPQQLSGGQKKRVQMAQCLIMGPKVILMDEPFSALDVHTRHLMQNELLRLWEEQKAGVVFITHDLEEAIALADRVVVMSAGPGSRFVAEFDIPLPRPRDVAEIKLDADFLELYRKIWASLRDEVEKSHAE
jgi:NitT/TauT family transport system ATP-binding protein